MILALVLLLAAFPVQRIERPFFAGKESRGGPRDWFTKCISKFQ
jgi:hypothetical protein